MAAFDVVRLLADESNQTTAFFYGDSRCRSIPRLVNYWLLGFWLIPVIGKGIVNRLKKKDEK